MTALNKVLVRFCPLFFVSISIGADKGIDYYNNNEFEKARQYYESILIDRNDDPAANFGLGATAFQQQDYAAAMKGFETALGTDNDKLKSSAYYNMANILAQNQRLEESLAFFRKSLELNPSDLDAKINYELIKFQLQQQQQQQNQDQNQNQDENDKDDEQSGDQKKQDQQMDKQQQEQNAQNDSSDEQESEQQSNQNEDQQEDQTQQQQQDIAENEKQKSQDKQNAAAILDALKKDEKINKKQQMSRAKKRKLEKDW
ncbi:MAG: tetratricopeptide repeat protein [Candidatus Marinimicrobia bacterium]|nr:tetratricopeptide repeat protein [Candidatus Neomarinimicrobiota bacterium]